MYCHWDSLLDVLPSRFRAEADKQGKNTLQEFRMRIHKPALMVTSKGTISLKEIVTPGDLNFVIQIASRYSPWAAATMAKGYLTAQGAHRIGVCGEAVVKNGEVTGFREITSLCIRVARDFPGIGERASKLEGNILLLGPPAWGKTTLLRDLLRQISKQAGQCVGVVDERGELFPKANGRFLFPLGGNLDVVSLCPKAEGLDMILRTMGPTCIGVDEVTSAADCDALVKAGWCGVRLIATVHAKSLHDLKTRPVYKPLIEKGLFDWAVILHEDKSYHWERMKL
ncbi:MAG: stage III sporulation protein AB [Oscillospiraceae bacterium]|nr:stage III sporulation protein AB [Oscillospiraceae bacterium]